MLKRLLASKPAVTIGSALAAAYVRLVYATSTIKRDPAETDAKLFDQHPQILAMWHGQFLLLPKLKPKRPADVRAMVSRHGDAEIIGAVLQEFGMDLIRGAGAGKRKRNRGGATALRESLRALASGATVAMTADVPPGPARRAGEGIATLRHRHQAVPCAPDVEPPDRQSSLLDDGDCDRRPGEGRDEQ
jgi:3-deoxy-D-manno-octulosonic-acid transferase